MEEQQNQNQEAQPEIVVEQPKKKTIPTRLGSLIILLIATIAGAGVWWFTDSYTPPEAVDVSGIVEQTKESREVKNELPEEYKIKADGVYYKDELIEEADIATFEYIEYRYAKDKNNIYYLGERVKNIDRLTFEYLGKGYAKDKNYVYYSFMKGLDSEVGIIKEADMETFEYLDNFYAKDKDHVYELGEVSEEENWRTGEVSEEKDPATFEILNRYITKDKDNVYYYVLTSAKGIFREADSATFEILGDRYYKDKDNVYYDYHDYNKIEGADPVTFEVLSEGYSKDKNYVYKNRKIVEGADPINCTAENLEGCKAPQELPSDYEIKADGVYYEGILIEETDPETFKYLNYHYAKDKNHVFYFRKLITEADSKTFEYLDYGYAKDKNNAYFESEIIADVDAETFEIVGQDNSNVFYAKDKNHVYKYEHIAYGIDPEDCSVDSLDDCNDTPYLVNESGQKIICYARYYYHINSGYHILDSASYLIVNKEHDAITCNRGETTFEELGKFSIEYSSHSVLGEYLVKDKNGVYACGKKLDGVDVDSMTEISEQYMYKADYEATLLKDRGHLYLMTCGDDVSHLANVGTILEGVDGATLEILSKHYIRDKNNVFYFPDGYLSNYYNRVEKIDFEILNEVDSATFVIIDSYYTKDSNFVYFENKIVDGANPGTIDIMGVNAFDFQNIYVNGKYLTQRDPSTFEIYNDFYFKNKNKIYYENGDELEGVDMDTFEIVEDKLARDENGVYVRGVLLAGADSNTIEIVKRLTQNLENIIGGITIRESFIVAYVLKDKNNVYGLDTQVIDDADADTFEFVASNRFDAYFKDTNHVYSMQFLSFFGELPSLRITGENPQDCIVFKNDDEKLEWNLGIGYASWDAPTQLPCASNDEAPACLASGTKILMLDGNYKDIENIKVGDMVTSYDIKTKEYTISKVDKVIKRKDPLVIINNTLRAAPDEPVYLADGTIKEAIDIEIGDYLVNEKGEQVKVNTIENNPELVDTYDFTLENGNNFFADGYLVRTPDL